MSLFYKSISGGLFILLLSGVVYTLGLYRLVDIAYYNGFDTISYLEAAKQLAVQHSFHPIRCIAYPGFLLVIKRIFSNGPYFFYAIYFIQIWMWWRVTQLQYRWLKLSLTERTAFLFAILSICNVSYFLYSFFLLTEIPCLFFITYAFEQTRRYLLNQHKTSIFFTALYFSIAILFKPGLFPFLLLFTFLLFIFFLLNKIKGIPILLFYAGAFIPLSIQWIGMYQSNNQFTLSYISDITNYRYFHTSVLALNQQQDILPLMQQRDSLVNAISSGKESYTQFASYVANERKSLFKDYPIKCIQAYSLNLFSNFHTGNTIPQALPEGLANSTGSQRLFFNITRLFNMTYVIALLITCFWGVYVWVFKKIEWNLYTIMTVIYLSFALFAFLISGISFYQGDRFNIIWMPFLVPAMANVWQWRRLMKN